MQLSAIAHNLQAVRNKIAATCQKSELQATVRLIAVSKRQPIEAIQEAIAAGQIDFGENFLQEALLKIKAINNSDVCWHFIGHIQSNKTRDIAEKFAWVHSVDRLKIAERLNAARPPTLPPLNVCIEVNIDDEDQKSGVSFSELQTLMAAIAKLPNLKLRGLMGMPKLDTNEPTQRKKFSALRHARDALNEAGFELDTLSMGTTQDMSAAILEGATMVRIGTKIFGSRG